MLKLFTVSATVRAEQLSRMNQESYCLEELLEHKNEVQSTYMLLISMGNYEKIISRNERANILNWTKKIFLKLARLNDLIQIAQIQEIAKIQDDNSDKTSAKSKKNYFEISKNTSSNIEASGQKSLSNCEGLLEISFEL